MQNHIDEIIKNGGRAVVIMLNGFQMNGRIVKAFPDYIVVRHDNADNIVFKHAISTIRPV